MFRCHRLQKECTPSVAVRKRQAPKAAPSSSSKRARLEDRLEDLVALLQTHNAQKSQEPAPAESPREPERQHPWIPNVWRRDASRKPETGPRPFNDMTPNVVGPSTSNPGWQEMVVTPATTANSTCSPLTPSSRLPDLPPAMAEAVLHEFRTVYTKNNPFLYIHPSVTVQEMQQERPFLWLVIRALCTKSYAEHHELGRLIREVLSNQLLVCTRMTVSSLRGSGPPHA